MLLMLCVLETTTTTTITTALCSATTTDVAYYEPTFIAQPSSMSDRVTLHTSQSKATRAELQTTWLCQNDSAPARCVRAHPSHTEAAPENVKLRDSERSQPCPSMHKHLFCTIIL